jgi:hypothetical protein
MTTAIWLRLQLQPAWVRFLVWAVIGMFSAVGISLIASPQSESIWSTVAFAVFLGVVVAASSFYSTRDWQTALTEAVAGLDQTQRSQAIAAVTHGVVPADQRVRSSAVRLGRAYLSHKSADELKRQQRRAWVVLAVVIAVFVALAAAVMWLGPDGIRLGLYLLALVLLMVVLGRLAMLRVRRIQRNISLLTDGVGAQ